MSHAQLVDPGPTQRHGLLARDNFDASSGWTSLPLRPAEVDRRKARIVACLYPSRIARGFKTEADMKRLAASLGVSRTTVREWEDGLRLPKDEQLPVIEAWLSANEVHRQTGIGRIVGTEIWPKPLAMPRQIVTTRQHGGLNADVAAQAIEDDVPAPASRFLASALA